MYENENWEMHGEEERIKYHQKIELQSISKTSKYAIAN
jgi:hypothetical protein